MIGPLADSRGREDGGGGRVRCQTWRLDWAVIAARNLGRFGPTRRSMRRRAGEQLELSGGQNWGGKRAGAGRRRVAERSSPAHRPRPAHRARWPVHVTLRAHATLPSLRSARVFPFVQRSLAAAHKDAFRVVHFSVQSDHVHLIVEGDAQTALVRGVQGLAVRCAKAVNRAVRRRGAVWSSRYHAHALRTPTEARRGLVYVLLNFRKHLRASPGLDPRSSAPWFDGWRGATTPPAAASPVAPPRTWLACAGWRRAGGPLSWDERPTATRPTLSARSPAPPRTPRARSRGARSRRGAAAA